MTENSNDETNSPHKLFLTDTQVLKILKAFANGSSANINFRKLYLSKVILSEMILGEILVASPYAAIKAGTRELIKRAPDWLNMQQNILLINEEIDLKNILH